MLLRQLFDPATSTYTYLVADESSREALLVDPVREQLERDRQLLSELGLELKYVLETHVHADHVTSAGPLADSTGAQTVVAREGAACGQIRVQHGDRLPLGGLAIEVLETPGHTNDSLSFVVDGHVFTGDCLFVRGTGRADFQNGDAHALYDSITKVLFGLPDATIVWPGHDYRGHTCSTIGEERRYNPRVAGRSREQFVALMNDLHLPPPRHLQEAVPANRACGRTTSAP
jgi:sulfur dioxygenase